LCYGERTVNGCPRPEKEEKKDKLEDRGRRGEKASRGGLSERKGRGGESIAESPYPTKKKGTERPSLQKKEKKVDPHLGSRRKKGVLAARMGGSRARCGRRHDMKGKRDFSRRRLVKQGKERSPALRGKKGRHTWFAIEGRKGESSEGHLFLEKNRTPPPKKKGEVPSAVSAAGGGKKKKTGLVFCTKKGGSLLLENRILYYGHAGGGNAWVL